MTDEIKTDATTALADVKGVISKLDTDAAKVKVFWADYRTYLVCIACFILGAIVGHKL